MPHRLAQDEKRPLDHSDYDLWHTIGQRAISRDGSWVMYSVRGGNNRSTLKIRDTSSKKEYSIPHAASARFTFDGNRAVFILQPDPDLARKLRKEKKTDQIPPSELRILDLATGQQAAIPGVSSYTLPEKNSDWIAFRISKSKGETQLKPGTAAASETYEVTPEGLKRSTGTEAKSTTATPKNKTSAKPEPKKPQPTSAASAPTDAKPGKSKKTKTEGSTLVLRSLNTGIERRFPLVSSFIFSKGGERLAFATSTKDDGDRDGVSVLDLDDEQPHEVNSGKGNYTGLAFNEDGSRLAFLSDRDDYEAEKPSWSLYLLRLFSKKAERIAKAGDDGIPKDWWVASSASPVFSEDSRRLYFSTAPIPEEVLHPTKEDDEPKAKLDLWHWKDPQLQPQQLLQAERDRNRSYRAVYDLRARRIVQLATKDVPVVNADTRSAADVAVGTSNEKYKRMMSWDLPGFQDTYLVNLTTGKREMVVEKIRAGGRLSPAGKFVTWWDPDKRRWYSLSTKTRELREMSRGIRSALFDELHDTPSPPSAYGTAGWLDDDAGILIYDRYDIWRVDPTGRDEPARLTDGRRTRVRYRYLRLDPEQRTIDPTQPLILSAFNERSKASGFARLTLAEQPSVDSLVMLDEAVDGLTKARETDTVIFTRSTFRKSPDVWLSTLGFKQLHRISRINPQQRDYVWGTAELVHWKSDDGKPLDGILYKPDGFDASKKYPMMVYFYERNSDNLHRYHVPAAGRSIISFSFYVSRGYVLFVPDIPYTTGFPGESAAKAILPGVRSVVDMGFVDKQRIGMQGHSWGGYQVAYLVTQTDMFACAESGAPVSNMTSAYGGIRWSSGMSRMFQYERTQSRIGQTLWQGRDRYIANSPVFFADKIHTPLLILHNDQDGAVPWYQGIELFVALRRLSKPAWMLNYNGEPHWVMKDENRRDFARRMQQFFDHYLKGEPEPEWMAHGIPAVDKGRKFGFEPAVEDEAPAKSETKETGSGGS